MTRYSRVARIVLGLLAAFSSPLPAHEEGVIRLRSGEVPAGGRLELRGERLPKATRLRLELRGAVETFPLGHVRTDAEGVFSASPTLPAGAGSGDYTVVAVAPDGDVAARAELTVVVALAGTTATAEAEHAGHQAMQPTASPHPTAEMMNLPVTTTGGELTVVAGIIALSLAGGLLLLRGHQPSRQA